LVSCRPPDAHADLGGCVISDRTPSRFLRWVVVLGVAGAVLYLAGSTHASNVGLNAYGAGFKFSPTRSGSGRQAAALVFTEHLTARGSDGNRTAPLTHIKAVLYGAGFNWRGFPLCSFATISRALSDTECPSGALIATGAIAATLGPEADASVAAPGTVSCDPVLHLWNGGRGKVVFFVEEQGPNHLCANGAIETGDVGPFAGTVRQVGRELVLDTPIPNYVSFPLGGIEAGLTSETLHYLDVTRIVGGKTVPEIAATGCEKGERPYSVTFTAEGAPGARPQSSTITGAQPCAGG
jgi:hypothetical protein